MNNKPMPYQPLLSSPTKVAIIGGGVAGSTIALRFAELGLDTTLIEKGPSLVNGPPICHLHAGGNLYREISDQQCLILLKQSIDTVKVYPACINVRPTIIALPKSDKGQPEDLLPRLEKLRAEYEKLVSDDLSNKVIGEPADYFQCFTRTDIDLLVGKPIPKTAQCATDWLIAFANHTNLDAIKFPIVLVQEYGMSAFRLAAIATLTIERLANCHLQTNRKVVAMSAQNDHVGWHITTEDDNSEQHHQQFDYVVNACGFKSGEIDDMLKTKRKRMVEFKAAYVAHWPQYQGAWPEIVFHGERGTPQGMAQLTPYPNGYFQLHGMTQDITLFEKGLVSSSANSAQPQLAAKFIEKIDNQWPTHLVNHRTLGSIDHIAQYMPSFSTATVAAKPMFGAQQIPGQDPDLRAADVSFDSKHYARAEIVKASSALAAADAILADLVCCGLVEESALTAAYKHHYFPVSQQSSDADVTKRAIELAQQREYPSALALNF
ncbi:MAG: FAD-dependent oxidoreductase [Cognaticolwellia sp.]